MSNGFRIYSGKGDTDREEVALPLFEEPKRMHDPGGYIASDGLRDAVNVALNLGQPLLLTGEPGTGKTELARSLAAELRLGDPLISHVKTSSTARDLFYRYDALGHFRDIQVKKEDARDIRRYIEYEALGLAILLATDPERADAHLSQEQRTKEAEKKLPRPRRSVVLLDEVDKAPRDLPNDILNEIEHMEFTVKETGETHAADRRYKPIVVLTSNSERNLPDAFLRRCVFFHLEFPQGDELRRIIRSRLGSENGLPQAAVEAAIDHFEEIRKIGQLKKKPATAELLGWLRFLGQLGLDLGKLSAEDKGRLVVSYSLLAKTKEDLALLQERYGA
jgi:MoxR-like ATPase